MIINDVWVYIERKIEIMRVEESSVLITFHFGTILKP